MNVGYCPQKHETIVAISTAQGPGALALIRISGPEALTVCEPAIKSKSGKSLFDISSHTLFAADFVSDNNLIDHCMVAVMKGPRTFTGYDTIEITCHNNRFIIQGIIDAIIRLGARPAAPGEFSRQAYQNNKIDLVQVEAINELIGAQTQESLKKSLAQLKGSLSATVQEIEDLLLKALAWCESSFEFLDDEGDFYQEIAQFLIRIQSTIEPILAGFAVQKHIRQGLRVSLIGSVNAGKSSLFNLLIGQKRAIVTPLAGTTRDSIESTVFMAEKTITFIDTAGLRTTADIIEKEGIERSYSEAHASDVILLIFDGSRAIRQEEAIIYTDLIARYSQKIVFVQTKADLVDKKHSFFQDTGYTPIIVATTDVTAKKSIEQALALKIALLTQRHELPFLVNRRHYELLQAAQQDINAILAMLQRAAGSPHYELIAYHIRQALEQISQITGKTASEMALDRVFKEFCVGK